MKLVEGVYESLISTRITGRFFDPLKMAESITDLRIYGFTEIMNGIKTL